MPQKSVVLVPVASFIDPDCEASLQALEKRGLAVWRVWGFSDISRGRSQIATDALAAGFENLIWIDSDIQFSPEDVFKLVAHNRPIVGGIYPIKNARRLACTPFEADLEIIFGEGGGLVKMKYLATGFLCTQRQVYEKMESQFNLPHCLGENSNGLVPYFWPMVVAGDEGSSVYLSEGFSFCERALQCGFDIFADSTIRLGHVGRIGFSWEDAGTEKQRYSTYRYRIKRGM